MEQVTTQEIGKYIFVFQEATRKQQEGMVWWGHLEVGSPALEDWLKELSASPQFLYFKGLENIKKGLPLASAKPEHISDSGSIGS